MFTGKNDGHFIALDADSGDVLWEFQTGAGVNAPPVVFEFEGRQHVAVYAAGALFAQSPPGDFVWLFSLEGEMDEVPDPRGLSAAEALFVKNEDVEADVVAGGEAYQRYCGQCHGKDGRGSHGGGADLTVSALSGDQVEAVIHDGLKQMPPFKSVLSDTQISSIALFVKSHLQ